MAVCTHAYLKLFLKACTGLRRKAKVCSPPLCFLQGRHDEMMHSEQSRHQARTEKGRETGLDVEFALQELRQQEAATSHQNEHRNTDAKERVCALSLDHIAIIWMLNLQRCSGI